MTYPYIVKALENGELELHGWWYNIKKGELEIYDYRTKKFVLAKYIYHIVNIYLIDM